MPVLTLLVDSAAYIMQDFDSIWYRRPRLASLRGRGLKQDGLDFARDEWRAFIDNSYELLDRPLWVSKPSALRRAANKPLQLQLAAQLGFRIPRTLVTNDPTAARLFIDECAGRVVTKATGSGWFYATNGADATYILTNQLTSNDMQDLGAVEVSPVTFQEEIAKAFEVRVNIVGEQCLPIRIESQRSPLSRIDWRRYDVANTPYLPFELPAEVERRCLLLCQALGLQFGALDLICQPDGEFVFLEVNGNGQFLWAEELSGVPVSDGIARLLAGIAAPLKTDSRDSTGGFRDE